MFKNWIFGGLLLFTPPLAVAAPAPISHQSLQAIASDKQPPQRNAQNPDHKSGPSDTNGEQSNSPPVSINAAPSITIQPYPAYKGDNSGNDALENLIKIFSDVAIAAFTGVLCLVAFWQFGALRAQVNRLDTTIEDARKDGGRQSRDVTLSIESAQKATRDTIETMERHAGIELRPYITTATGETIETPIMRDGKEIGVQFEFHPFIVNTGRTPAHNLTYVATSRVLPLALIDSFAFALTQQPNPSITVIGPRQQTTMIIPLDIQGVLTPEEANYLKMDKMSRPFIWGTITYTDPLAAVAGAVRTTNFCYYVVWGNKGFPVWIAHSRHNDAT